MCISAIGRLMMEDEGFQKLLSNPTLDLIHKQVVMTLYSLAAVGRLHECREMLPIYLSLDWEECSAILDTIEKAGLLVRIDDTVSLTHPIITARADQSCGC
jgi:hypothetical protein